VPSTYAPQDAINLVTAFAHGAPLAIPTPVIVDQVNSFMWRYYPWGWSIRSLNQTNLVQLTTGPGTPPTGGSQFTGNQQDYTITGAWANYPISLLVGGTTNNNYGGGFVVKASPNGFSEVASTITINTLYAHNLPVLGAIPPATLTLVSDNDAKDGTTYNGATVTITSIPNNTTIIGTASVSAQAPSGGSGAPTILRPLKMRIARLDTNPPEYRELSALGNLAPELSRTAGVETMQAVGWFASQSFFRFDYAPQVAAGQIIQLLGEYQARPTKITPLTVNTPFPFPDDYFSVLEAGLLWRVYQLLDDPRAGVAQLSENGNSIKQYTGQMGTFMYDLREMARTEDLAAGDEFRFPADSLGQGRSYWPGLYGL